MFRVASGPRDAVERPLTPCAHRLGEPPNHRCFGHALSRFERRKQLHLLSPSRSARTKPAAAGFSTRDGSRPACLRLERTSPCVGRPYSFDLARPSGPCCTVARTTRTLRFTLSPRSSFLASSGEGREPRLAALPRWVSRPPSAEPARCHSPTSAIDVHSRALAEDPTPESASRSPGFDSHRAIFGAARERPASPQGCPVTSPDRV